MVCFCDIPLTFVKSNNYGHFALGMTRTWGIEQHLLPVSYYPNNKRCLSTIVVKKASEAFLTNRAKTDDYEILGYSKPMYKIQKTASKKKNNYEEREWRKIYSPRSLQWKTEEEYSAYRGSKNSSKDSIGVPLTFKVRDIDFILVPDSDVPSIIKCIKRLSCFGGNNQQIDNKSKDLLLAKIISFNTLAKNI